MTTPPLLLFPVVVLESLPKFAAIITRMGYALTHRGIILDVGKICWMQDMAVSRSCAPPSQFRDCIYNRTIENGHVRIK